MNKKIKIGIIVLVVTVFAFLMSQSLFLPKETIEDERTITDKEEIIQEAMSLIYSNFNEENNQAKWVLSEEDFKKLEKVRPSLYDLYVDRKFIEFGELCVGPITYEISNNKIYLVTATIPQENQHYSRSEGAIIGTHLFAIEKGSLKEIHSNKVFTIMGSAGYFNEDFAKTVRISENDFAFMLKSGWTMGGSTTERTIIVLFDEGEFKEVFNQETFLNHDYLEEEPEREVINYSSEIDFFSTKESNFYDIKINKKNIIKVGNEEKESSNEIHYYRFQEGVYQELKTL